MSDFFHFLLLKDFEYFEFFSVTCRNLSIFCALFVEFFFEFLNLLLKKIEYFFIITPACV